MDLSSPDNTTPFQRLDGSRSSSESTESTANVGSLSRSQDARLSITSDDISLIPTNFKQDLAQTGQMQSSTSASGSSHPRPLVLRLSNMSLGHSLSNVMTPREGDEEALLETSTPSGNACTVFCLEFMAFLKSLVNVDRQLIAEATPSCLISAIGLVAAGVVLDVIQHWPVFEEISELFIMVPILLGLKGNMEMNLAARLSTHARQRQLEDEQERKEIVLGNLALLQVQALVVGCIAGFVSWVLGCIFHARFNPFSETMLMMQSAMLCASLSSLLLGSLMCALVIGCTIYDINPDNVATPIAASLGDLITLGILALFSSWSYSLIHTHANLIVFILLLSSLPFWLYYAYSNKHVKAVLFTGWTPLLISMVISSFAGLVLERFINKFEGLAVLLPVQNGIVGNWGAILCSRFSVRLHAGEQEDHAKTQMTLFWLNLPLQWIFLVIVHLFSLGHTSITSFFVVGYTFTSQLFTWCTLLIGYRLTKMLWDRGLDPDDHVLPYMSSIADVLGTVMLVVCFWFLYLIGDRDMDVGD